MSEPTEQPQTRLATGWVIALVALPPLVYLGNPAVALLVGAAASLVSGRLLLASAAKWGGLLLQAAIVLVGFRLSIDQVLAVSADTVWLVMGYVVCVFVVGLLLGRWLSVERDAGVLMASGTAICGGTAVAAMAPILNARSEQISVVIAIIFALNALALFTFPALGAWLGLEERAFGIWVALAVHDTSSVIATAALYGEEALAVATTVKLGRTLWLIPLVLGTSLWLSRSTARTRVPAFILAFLATAALGSTFDVPERVLAAARVASEALLVAALFFVGMSIVRDTVREIRGRVLVQALVLWGMAVAAALAALMLFYR